LQLFENGGFVGLRRIAGNGVEAQDHFSGGGVVGGDVAAHAEFRATVADQTFPLTTRGAPVMV